ncbi:MAG: ABC transporter permease [Chloroflexota bacterium]|nr:ABC transporter permease [Chloroflexota bacterium]
MAQTTLFGNETAIALPGPESDSARGRRLIFVRRCVSDRTLVTGTLIVLTFVIAALAAPLITSHDPTEVDALAILAPPSPEHWLGTDNIGRDIFSRLVYGARWSLGASVLAATAIVVVGVTLGVIAGYFGGLIDDLLMRLVDVLLAFPSLVLALAIVGTLGPSLRNVLIGMVAVWWVDYARVMRGLTVGVREREFVAAAHCLGASSPRVMLRHILPNVVPSVIVLATLELGGLMLAISGLSFLGLGAQPPTPEWGTMLNDGRLFFQRAPQLMLYPGLAITLVVVGCNLVGDGLRDALDPRLKR